MKKIMFSFLLAIFAISLTACSANAPESNKKPQIVTVQVRIGKKSADYKVTQNSTLLALTQKKLHANVTKGFINSIDGMSSNPKTDCYLMFKVNGKVSQVGAADVKLKNGEKIEFYLSKF